MDVCNLVNRMTLKHNSGKDESFLSKIVSVIKVPLCVVFNKSVFPQAMKIAKINAVHKGN